MIAILNLLLVAAIPQDECWWTQQLHRLPETYCDSQTPWYWGDWNFDMAIDAADVHMLVQCAAGPGVKPTDVIVSMSVVEDGCELRVGAWAWDCAAMDVDGDGDVDQVEFAAMQRMLGPAF